MAVTTGDCRIRLRNLTSDSPRDHHSDHLVVSHERPEWILKRRWPVFLNGEMTQPGETVTGNEPKWKQPPTATCDEVDQQRDSDCRSN